MHVFPYSIRKGTKAAEMSDQIDGLEKERRSKILIELSNFYLYLDWFGYKNRFE